MESERDMAGRYKMIMRIVDEKVRPAQLVASQWSQALLLSPASSHAFVNAPPSFAGSLCVDARQCGNIRSFGELRRLVFLLELRFPGHCGPNQRESVSWNLEYITAV